MCVRAHIFIAFGSANVPLKYYLEFWLGMILSLGNILSPCRVHIPFFSLNGKFFCHFIKLNRLTIVPFCVFFCSLCCKMSLFYFCVFFYGYLFQFLLVTLQPCHNFLKNLGNKAVCMACYPSFGSRNCLPLACLIPTVGC